MAGVIATGVLAGAVALPTARATASDSVEISALSVADIAAAMGSLEPGVAAALASQARDCKTPMAVLTLVRAPDAPVGPIRIRAGAYLSPPFQVGATPIRVAVPFPAAYSAGTGQFGVEGPHNGLNASLSPTWFSSGTGGAAVINVWWRTDQPCGR
ncbi:hypothetical protein M2323_004173 [Rhodoblastus acidophilus]|uniref:hypothetical protein n=1 Tax=Rhodoblastus acidophilus TaxID=1074 RepID=UPI00222465CC|nr:hypothetical protein [Rhodoblastus acidophilus]MCW2286332.1 hypothetical protein [Rhodoblastus acidophilus]MCW2335227.1 hypothetical protein [Rhodoblastus acidophilus]